jgi:hypothetical protein
VYQHDSLTSNGNNQLTYQSVKTRRIMDDWREVPISQNEKKNIMIRSKLTYYPFAFYPGTEMAHFDQSYNYWLPVSGTEMAHFDQSYNYWFRSLEV